MIEEFIRTAVGALLSQGGGWLAAVILGVVVYVMDKRLSEANKRSEDNLREQYDSRITEFRDILEVVGTSTQSLHTMQLSVKAYGETTNQLTQAFAKLLRETEGQKDTWGSNHALVVKQLDDIQRRVEYIQKGPVS